MRNYSPQPVQCALCQTNVAAAFTIGRMWVLQPASGFLGDPLRYIFAVCDECLDSRNVRFEPHHSPEMDNWTGVRVYGQPTLGDLEKRIEALEHAPDCGRRDPHGPEGCARD